MLNKVIYDPHHTHIGLVRPGSAPAGTRPPTHIYYPPNVEQDRCTKEQEHRRSEVSNKINVSSTASAEAKVCEHDT